jgi:polyhydroxybutyrate depolymerase
MRPFSALRRNNGRRGALLAGVLALGMVVSALPAVSSTAALSPGAGVPEPSGPAPTPGCATSAAGPAWEEERFIDVGGTPRSFLITVPGSHDGSRPLPVVFSFHGLYEGARVHTQMSEWSGIAEREGFVVVFPHGRFDPVRWDADPVSDPNEDIRFVEAILERLGDELCLDQRRVYASGLSYGAFMTSLVACKLSARFAAVAPVAGVRLAEPCDGQRPVPLVTFHGTDDAIVLFNGGFGAIPVGGETPTAPPPADLDGPGTPAYVAGWAERNGCDPDPTDTQTSAEILHRVYDCPDGADVEFFIVLGGGHTWPGSEFSRAIESIVGHTTFDIHASEEAWRFFTRFALPCPAGQRCDPYQPTTTVPAPPAVSPPAARPTFTG